MKNNKNSYSLSITRNIIPLISILFLSGCTTTLEVYDLSRIEEEPKPFGVLYNLPETEFQVEVVRTLVECNLKKTYSQPIKLDVKWQSSVSVKIEYPSDPKEAYLISYLSLNKVFKKSSLSITQHSNGMLKSINADIEDRTAAVSANIIKGAINVAKLVLGVPSMPFNKTESLPTTSQGCNQNVRTALSVLKTKKNERRIKFGELEVSIPNDEKRIKSEIAAIEKVMKKEMSKLTYKQMYFLSPIECKGNICISPKFMELPLNYTSDNSKYVSSLVANEGMYSKWFNEEGAKIIKSSQGNSGFDGFDIKAYLRIPDKFSGSMESIDTSKNQLIYRKPVNGLLTLCHQKCFSGESLVPSSKQIYSEYHKIPEAGNKLALPFESGVFGHNTFKASFGISGDLLSFDYTTEAQAEAASAAFADTTQQVSGLISSLRSSNLTKIQASTTKLQAETENYKAQQEKIESKQALEDFLDAL
jgi:hypothetical protein